MRSPLRFEFQQEARELARDITVAHDLDPEFQEELYGHIEDKLLAYKSGEERISDEDAFILVREHFGDSRVLRERLQEVHMKSVQVSLMRKLLALTVAMMGLGLATRAAHIVLALILAPFMPSGTPFERLLTGTVFTWTVAIAGLTALLLLLRHWRITEFRDDGAWFERWSIGRILVLAIALLTLKWALPGVVFAWQFSPQGFSDLPIWLTDAWFWGTNAVLFFVWLWWADAAKRTVAQLIAISSMCAIVHFISSSVPVVLLLSLGTGSEPERFARLFVGRIGGTEFSALASFQGFPIMGEFLLLLKFGLCASICTVFVWCTTRALYRLRHESDTPVAAS